jgi:aspartate racemase
MKTIGLVGGMSWESTLSYYKIINEYTNELLGNQNNAKSIIYTINFEEIEKLQHLGKWDEASNILQKASLSLQNAGAEFIIICTNTMHKLLPQIQQHIDIPFLHIAKATTNEIKRCGMTKIGLLGTKFTMQEDFYKQILIDEDINVIIPDKKDMEIIHQIIYSELCLGNIQDNSKKIFIDIINKMDNIEGVILGCTEIGLLINQNDFNNIQVFDTTEIHAKQAVEYSLKDESIFKF